MKAKIGDLTKIRTGKLDANASSEDGMYPFFTCSKEPLRISTHSYDCECVLIAGNGDLNVKYYNGKFDAYQRTYIIEENGSGKLYMPYLYYFMEGYIDQLRKQAIGGVIKYIKLSNLTDAMIELPDLDVQKSVVQVLGKVKKIIDLKYQVLLSLDEIIKSRFVEMFYDKGYSVLKWNDVFNTTTGKLDSNAAVDGGTYPFFTCSKEVLRIDDYAFEEEALLLAGNNAAGKYDVKYYSGKFNAYQRTYVLTLKENWSYRLFQYQLEDKLTYLQQQSLGGLTKYLTLKILGELEFIIPPKKQQDKFDLFIKQIDKSKLIIQKSLDELETLNKALMQKYFGGN